MGKMGQRFKSSKGSGSHKADPNDLSNITVESEHNRMVEYFRNLQKSLPEKKKALKRMIKEYKEAHAQLLANKMDLDLIIYKSELHDQMEEMKRVIASIENREEENHYYLEVSPLLHNYFETIEQTKYRETDEHDDFFHTHIARVSDRDEDEGEGECEEDEGEEEVEGEEDAGEEVEGEEVEGEDAEGEDDEVEEETHERPSQTISVEEVAQKIRRSRPQNDGATTYSSTKITDFVTQECIMNKKEILDEYLKRVDKNYAPKLKLDTSIFQCPSCNTEMTLYISDGVQICEQCGMEQSVLIESEKPSFKDPPLEAVFFSYKRINHFNELLAQFQAKESTEIPDEVYDMILGEIKKERVKNLADITTQKIKKYLKKNNMTKYTDHVAHILYKINGIPPPSMSKDLEEKLRMMFKEIQGPFIEVCPRDRKNLLNYYYVLHKFVELLGLDSYKRYFPLLKDREKLYNTEMVWKKICEKLGWPFIRSI